MAQSANTADFHIATGPADRGGAPPVRNVSGVLSEEIWRLPANGADPAAIMSSLRAQLIAQGYAVTFACADRACGGFDFRFALPIAQAPEMFVDLGNFHYLAAQRGLDEAAEDIALTVSVGGNAGYVHLARIGGGDNAPTALIPSFTAPQSADLNDLIARLIATGHVVLEDLTFETGASALSGNRYDSLAALAEWLAGDNGRRIALVGHTDAEGALDRNIALSEARAAAVRQSLINDHGAAADQISAAGVGYLSPRATNTTPDGREANRRVEVVLLAQ
ncbi:OmpA family protein [Roseicyclus sp.]|uniref:OmpA family protein n=1 Tax=Roseicyclus sp. TaxID=1914329 RepID=UPI003F6BA120